MARKQRSKHALLQQNNDLFKAAAYEGKMGESEKQKKL
jgi:hypothetical protein